MALLWELLFFAILRHGWMARHALEPLSGELANLRGVAAENEGVLIHDL